MLGGYPYLRVICLGWCNLASAESTVILGRYIVPTHYVEPSPSAIHYRFFSVSMYCFCLFWVMYYVFGLKHVCWFIHVFCIHAFVLTCEGFICLLRELRSWFLTYRLPDLHRSSWVVYSTSLFFCWHCSLFTIGIRYRRPMMSRDICFFQHVLLSYASVATPQFTWKLGKKVRRNHWWSGKVRYLSDLLYHFTWESDLNLYRWKTNDLDVDEICRWKMEDVDGRWKM